MRGNAHVRFGGAGRGNGPSETTTPRPGPTHPPRGPPGAGQGLPAGDGRRACRRHQRVGRAHRGHRESSESWADLLRDCKRRGMAAPVLAIGDGALGFWAALRDVFPATREQRCWSHKIADVLNALPKSAQPGAKAALAEIWNAEDREHAEAAARSFVAEYGIKWPKAVAELTDDLRIAGGRRGDGVQAHRVRPATVACRQRTPPRRSRLGRSPVREGPPGRTSRRIRRRSASRMTRQSAGLDYCSCAREGAPDEC